MDIASVTSIIGALGIGSFIGQYLIGSQQRRQLRSDVLRCLSNTEKNRWAGPASTDPKRAEFNESIRELETAALIARVPRKTLVTYMRLAIAARGMSEIGVAEGMGYEEDGGINAVFADIVRDSAAHVTHSLWSPWIAGITAPRRLRELRRRTQGIDNNLARSALEASARELTYY